LNEAKHSTSSPFGPPSTARIALTVFGMCSVIFGFAIVSIYFAASHGPNHLNPSRTALLVGFFVTAGVFTSLGYRWGALILAVPLAAVAGSLTVGSVFYVPFPWMVINFFFAALLCLPLVATVRAWRLLR
jgi:hypothetical protein